MFDEIEKRRPLSDSLQELEKWHAVGDIRDAFGKKAKRNKHIVKLWLLW